MSAFPQDDDALLAQCEVHVFRSSGPGGQHVNRRETAVRLRHRPTGIVTVSRQERSQHRNRAIALRQLRRKLKVRFAVRKARLPTSIPRRAGRRRLEDKKRQGLKKALRRSPPIDD